MRMIWSGRRSIVRHQLPFAAVPTLMCDFCLLVALLELDKIPFEQWTTGEVYPGSSQGINLEGMDSDLWQAQSSFLQGMSMDGTDSNSWSDFVRDVRNGIWSIQNLTQDPWSPFQNPSEMPYNDFSVSTPATLQRPQEPFQTQTQLRMTAHSMRETSNIGEAGHDILPRTQTNTVSTNPRLVNKRKDKGKRKDAG